jgi:hypothetical protein
LFRKTLIILFFVSVAASIQAQASEILKKRIQWEFQTQDFRLALQSFEKVTGLYFQYDAQLTPKNKGFQISYKGRAAGEALNHFLNGHGLTYAVVLDQFLVLKPWKPVDRTLRVSGSVSHQITGERIVGARIYDVVTGHLVYTDQQGLFNVRTEDSLLVLGIEYPGFETLYDTFYGASKSYFKSWILYPELSRMEEAEVKVSKPSDLPRGEEGWSDRISLNGNQLNRYPHFFGENDVMRAFSATPGVVSGSEGVFGMYVRGGAADQNLVLLDDVPIYNPYHMYGLFGIFNGDIIKNAQFYRGSFPANHGGRLSSLIQVDTKEGDPNQFQGSINMGLLSSRLYFSGPLLSNKTSFMVAARRSSFDVFVEPVVSRSLLSGDNLINRYRFWDVNAKITHRFSERSRLSVMVYSGEDRAGLIDQQYYKESGYRVLERAEDVSRWGSDVASLKWDWSNGTGSSLSMKAYYTSYKFEHERLYLYEQRSLLQLEDLEETRYNVSNGIYDVETSIEWRQQWGSRWQTQVGMGQTFHSFRPNRRELETNTDSVKGLFVFNDERINTPEYHGFLKVEYHGGRWGFYDVGCRLVYYDLGFKQFYLLPEPRLNARWILGKREWLKVSLSENRQFFHQLNNLSMGLPSDLWVPSTARFRPALSRQFAIGYMLEMNRRWQFQAEAFTRQFQDILEYSESAVYITSNRNWEQSVTSGAGRVNGIEFQLQRSGVKWSGMLSYTLMRSDRLFEALNDGKPFPSRYDRRHTIYATWFYRITPSWSVSASWMFNSGFAYTRPVGIIPSPTAHDPALDIYLYGERNNLRSIDNHRLDVSFTYEKKHLKNGVSRWSFGLYNAYNRLNPFYINVGLAEEGRRSVYQVSLLPVLPFVNYQWSF